MRKSQKLPSVLVEDTAAEATALTAEVFKSIVCEAVDRRGVCNLALAGGTTPHALYQQLAQSCGGEELPWQHVHVFFGDERNVPQDHVESNFRMVQQTLLDHVPIPPDHVHPMPADAEDLPAAAAEFEAVIRHALGTSGEALPQFDLILLGMGGDGHVASLFPETEAVDETSKLVSTCFVPVLGRNRMTFTFPLINASRNVVLLVTGADKAEAVACLLGKASPAGRQLPAEKLAPAGSFTIILDRPAATDLDPPE